jgi:hypothetical protein
MNERRSLPQRRHCETFEMDHANIKYTITIGYYNGVDENSRGPPGEIFASMSKNEGSAMDTIVRDGAILLSLCLQYGAPLEVIKRALTRNADDSPAAIMGVIAERLEG